MKQLSFFLIMLFSPAAWATNYLAASGDALHLLLPAAAFSATLFEEDNHVGSWQLTKATLSSYAIKGVMNYVADKSCPYKKDEDNLLLGHTPDSFAVATFVNQRYGWQYGLPAFAVATYVGYTQIADGKHNLQEELAGAAIGGAMGWFFTSSYEGVAVTPVINKDLYGIFIRGRF